MVNYVAEVQHLVIGEITLVLPPVLLLLDGKVNLTVGQVDVGGSRTSMSLHMAEVLKIPVEDINPQVGNTDAVGYTSLTAGSGGTFKSGWAVYEAAQQIKTQIIERAGMIWESPIEEIEYIDGIVKHKSDPELKMNFKEVAKVSTNLWELL